MLQVQCRMAKVVSLHLTLKKHLIRKLCVHKFEVDPNQKFATSKSLLNVLSKWCDYERTAIWLQKLVTFIKQGLLQWQSVVLC